MNCEKCGTQVSSDNKYCPNCGRKIIFRKEIKTSDSVAIGDNYNIIAGFLVLLYFILSLFYWISNFPILICCLILAIMLFAKSSKQYLAFVLLLITVISILQISYEIDYLQIASWLLIFVLTAINIKTVISKINKFYFLPAVFQAIYVTYSYCKLNSFRFLFLYWLKELILVFAMIYLGHYVIMPEQIKVKNNGRLKTERSLILYILLSIATFGLYGYYFIYSVAKDVNVVCKDDEQKTPGLIIYILFSFLTLGIYSLYWEYKVGNRIQKNAVKYDITIVENGSSILLWRVFGLLICGIGTFIGTNILIKNTNAICSAYNKKYQLF